MNRPRPVRARCAVRVGDREIEAVTCEQCPSWSRNLIAPPQALETHIAKHHSREGPPARCNNMVRGVSLLPLLSGRYRGGKPLGPRNQGQVNIRKVRGRNG